MTLRHPLLLSLVLSISGCSLAHKMEIQQGNIINQKQMEQLKVGMTRSQVTFLLGSPVLNDDFTPNQWEYLYYVEPAGGAPKPKHLILNFEGDQLATIDNRYPPNY